MKSLYTILITISFLLSSCSLNNSDIERDETTGASTQELIEPVIATMARNQSGIAGRSVAGLCQHYSAFGATILPPSESYLFSDVSFDNSWTNGFYNGSLINAKELSNLGISSGDIHAEVIGRIVQVHEFMMLTYLFGDIPYSEALQGDDKLTPSYDTQESIYHALIIELDDIIESIGSSGSNSDYSVADQIYGGDLQKWKKLAYGLKARLLLSATKKIASNYNDILDIVTQNGYSDESEQATFRFSPNFENPIYSFGVERPYTLFLGFYLVNFLQDSDDPRLDSYYYEEEDYNLFFMEGQTQLTWAQASSAIPIYSYVEQKFMEAEALLHTGGSLSAVSVVLRDAIAASLRLNDLLPSENEEFLDTQSDLSNLTLEEAQQRIIEQAYIAYYGNNSMSVYNNYRRTDYPKLQPTGQPSSLNPSGELPRRLPYPTSELEYNLEQVEIAQQRQNGAFMEDDIWFFE